MREHAITMADIRVWVPYNQANIMVDRIIDYSPGERISSLKTVTKSEGCYQHLTRDTRAAMYSYPASLVLTSWGQTAVIFARATIRDTMPAAAPDLVAGTGYFRGWKSYRRVFPGDVLRHVLRLEQTITERNFVISGETRVGDELVATIDSFCTIVRPASELTARMTIDRKERDNDFADDQSAHTR